MFVYGVTQEEKERFANMLNCRVGEMPMKYLGIPVSHQIITANGFSPLVQKVNKRLDPWKGKFLTSGGKQILTNTCLSSIPIYIVWAFISAQRWGS